jgi:Arc/MetJ family transcription regulator
MPPKDQKDRILSNFKKIEGLDGGRFGNKGVREQRRDKGGTGYLLTQNSPLEALNLRPFNVIRSPIPQSKQQPSEHQNAVHRGAIIGVKGKVMRASVTLDDDLLKTAHEYTGMTERAELLREALKSIIAREAGRRLLALAGTAPNIKDVRRRRVDEP